MPAFIPAVQAVAPSGYLQDTDRLTGASVAGTAGTSAASSTGGTFAATLAGAVDNTQALQSTANNLAIQAVTGDLTDIHQATLAATRAQVTLELVAAVRNKGVDAFNEIMRMQA